MLSMADAKVLATLHTASYMYVCMGYNYRNDECVEGGESILLDLYSVVQELRETHPEHFDTLTRVPATNQKILDDEWGVV